MEPLITDDEDPIATWEALLLPDWRWEALRKEEEGLYFGRVKSPNTYDNWEYGYFSQEQLEEARAYRVDEKMDENKPIFPDGRILPGIDPYETLVDPDYLHGDDYKSKK